MKKMFDGMLPILAAILAVSSAIVLVFIAISMSVNNSVEIKKTELFVDSEAIVLEHVNSRTMIINGQVHRTPEKFLVHVSYGELSATFDNQTLYESVMNGNEISILLVQRFDKESGELVEEYLSMP